MENEELEVMIKYIFQTIVSKNVGIFFHGLSIQEWTKAYFKKSLRIICTWFVS